MTYETQEQLDADLAYWQKVLRLQDWVITAKVVPGREIEGRGQAHAKILLSLKQAQIRLMDPAWYDPDGDQPLDHLCDLIHEMVHLHYQQLKEIAFNGSEPPMGYHLAEEQAVECMAYALVRLRREGRQLGT